MPSLTTRTHGLLDYATGLTLAVLPRLIGASPKVTALLQGSAAAHVGYSLLTDYELGAVRAIPMKGHLLLDAVGAAGFIAAGALMDDEEPGTRALLAGLGVYELAATLLTQATPKDQGTTRALAGPSRRQPFPPNFHPADRAGIRPRESDGAPRQSDLPTSATQTPSAMRTAQGDLVLQDGQ